MRIPSLLPAVGLLLLAACGRAPAPDDTAAATPDAEAATPATEASPDAARPVVTYYSIPG